MLLERVPSKVEIAEEKNETHLVDLDSPVKGAKGKRKGKGKGRGKGRRSGFFLLNRGKQKGLGKGKGKRGVKGKLSRNV